MLRARTLYAVGDVHGCAAALREMLSAVRADASRHGDDRPRLVLLGDLVDRGPDSCGVLEILTSPLFEDEFESSLIRGNHDQAVLDVLDHLDSDEAVTWLLRYGGAEMLESYGIDLRDQSAAAALRQFGDIFPDHHRALLRSTGPAFREGELFLAHAGIDPDLALDAQDPATTREIRSYFLRHPGPFEARVVHGHTPTATGEVEVHPHRIAVDTGAGFEGCKLSVAAIDPDGRVRSMSSHSLGCQIQLRIPA